MNSSNEELLNKLQNMDEYKFEKLVADLWEEQGWNTTVTSGSNDRGVDVIAEKETPFYQKQVIQAKCYSSNNKVGSPDIQQYSSLKHQIDSVDNVIVVTTSDFTSQAQDTAGDLDVKTINKDGLVSLIDEVFDDSISNKYALVAQSDRSSQIIKLNKIIQSGGRADLYSDNARLGYKIMPTIGGNFNVHVVHKRHSSIELDASALDKVRLIGKNNNLELLTFNDYSVRIGREFGEVPEVEEIKSIMEKILTKVYSISSKNTNIVINK